MFLQITDAEYLDGYLLRLRFSHSVEGGVDLQPELYGEVLEPVLDRQLFQQVFLTSRVLEWSHGADFAPEFLLSLVQTPERVTA